MNDRKHLVLHLITSLRGGPGRLLCDMLTIEEARRTYDHVICSMYVPDPALYKRVKSYAVQVRNLRMSGFFDVLALRRLARIIKDLKPRVLHTSGFRADLFGQFLGKTLKVPVRIASILNTDDIAVKEDYGRFYAQLFILVYRSIAKWSNGFIASSEKVANNLIDKKIQPARLAVFHNAINIDLFLQDASLSRETYRSMHDFKPDEIVIGSASVFNKRKGIPYLIEAFACLAKTYPNTRLFLPGNGPMKKDLGKMVLENPEIKEVIVLPGPVDNMTDFLNAIDIYVQPALSEGLPLAVLQAMAAGKPILATCVGGIPEAIRNGIEGLLVNPRDVEALASSLAQMIQDPKSRQMLGENAKRRVFRDFHSKQLAQKVISFYDRLSEYISEK
jgi:glycosyltransferase involved in cell wall biosynthesis